MSEYFLKKEISPPNKATTLLPPSTNYQPTTLYDWAKFYRDELHWSIIPIIKRTKKPLVEWKVFQTRLANDEELDQWFKGKSNLEVGIGLVTGKLSGVIVVDEDTYKQKEGAPAILSTLKSKTGRGGIHHFFQLHNELRNSVNDELAVDIRAEGGFVVLPPTIHPNGKQYEWIDQARFGHIPELPPAILQAILPANKRAANNGNANFREPLKAQDFIGLNQGSRNDRLHQFVCSLLNKHPEGEARTLAWAMNLTFNPPLGEKEFNTLFDSAITFIRANPKSSSYSNNKKEIDKQRDKWQFFSADDLKEKDLPPPEFTVTPLAVEDGINMISGDPASMKSMVLVHMAIQITKGEKVFGKFDSKQSGVLVVDDENGERELKKRFNKLGAFSASLPLHYIAYPDPPMAFELADVQYLITKCKEMKASVIMFDSYVRFLDGKSENESSDTSEINRTLKEFVKTGITVIFIHHHRKAGLVKAKGGQEARGSSDLLAGVNSHLIVSKKKDSLVIKQVKLREDKALEPFEVMAVDSENKTKLSFEYVGEVKPEADLLEEAKTAILDILSQSDRPLYTKEISDAVSEAVGIGKKTSDNALKELVSEKSVELDPNKHEKNRNYYYLPDDKPSNDEPVDEIQKALDQI
ncbi:MAG: AAA family ATPase [Candidatus Andersenbacteria bacterium]|nr:AAA family ATPase [Candidatus Andersenbacteria bacterium]MBI3250367.1 AAA family ATPase [Candidatus Andersenbacteria bacterium]